MAAIAVAGALAGGYVQRRLGPSSTASLTRLSAVLPPNEQFRTGLCPNFAVSPDGKFFAYIGIRERRSHLFLRAMDSLDATALPGTEGVSDTVFFSPDGLWLGFLQGQSQLKKISIGGGSPVAVANTPGCGADWAPDDQIVIASIAGIFQVPASGGALKPLILTDTAKGERGLGFPQVLPGGKALLFTVRTDQGAQLVAQRLASGERHVLIKGDTPRTEAGYVARYASPGFLIYSQADSLLAAPFNLDRLEFTGPPVPIARGVGQIGSQFSLSRSAETLVYVLSEPAPPSTLVWVDRKGAEEPLGAVPGRYLNPRISPDGHKVALAADSDLWVYDIARQVLTRITSAGDNRAPVWTPDGRRIAYSANGRIAWSLADGSSREELEPGGAFRGPTSWSPDGKRLLFSELGLNRQSSISVLSLDGERKATSVVQSRFRDEQAVFSPDGRRFAYVSDESGRPEVYVQEFPGPAGKLQVSSQGGVDPVWARQGGELFYRSGVKMMVVDTVASDVFHVSAPRTLFEGKYNSTGFLRNHDVSADGQRFLMVKSGGASPPVTHFNAVLNWVEDVKRRSSAK
jgi:serine/threonine-protein kinase